MGVNGRMRVRVRVARGEDALAWREAVGAWSWLDASVTLKKEGADWVRRATLRVGGHDRDVVIKRRTASGLGERVRMTMGLSRLSRQWRGAARLARAGVGTARPLALVRCASPVTTFELLAMEALPGKSVLGHLADGDLTVRQEHAVARALGEMIAGLARAGLRNRDGKPSNLIVTGFEDEEGRTRARIGVVDTAGIVRARGGMEGTGVRGRTARMLASLWIEAVGVGLTPREALRGRVVLAAVAVPGLEGRMEDRARFRGHWGAAAGVVRAHGDPRPRVDPLAKAV